MKRYEQLNKILGSSESPEDAALGSTLALLYDSIRNRVRRCEDIDEARNVVNDFEMGYIEHYKAYYKAHLEWLKEDIDE